MTHVSPISRDHVRRVNDHPAEKSEYVLRIPMGDVLLGKIIMSEQDHHLRMMGPKRLWHVGDDGLDIGIPTTRLLVGS